MASLKSFKSFWTSTNTSVCRILQRLRNVFHSQVNREYPPRSFQPISWWQGRTALSVVSQLFLVDVRYSNQYPIEVLKEHGAGIVICVECCPDYSPVCNLALGGWSLKEGKATGFLRVGCLCFMILTNTFQYYILLWLICLLFSMFFVRFASSMIFRFVVNSVMLRVMCRCNVT